MSLIALGSGSGVSDRVGALQQAALRMGQVPDDIDLGVTARAWRGYAAALVSLAHLGRWDAAVIAAEPDGDRHLRAARRNAELATELLDSDHPAHQALMRVLERLGHAQSMADADGIATALLGVALPTPLIAPAGRRRTAAPVSDHPKVALPRLVCVVAHAGAPLAAPVVVKTNTVHELTLTARVFDWPEEKPELVLRPVTVWPTSAVEATEVRLARPDGEAGGFREATGTTRVVLHAAAQSKEPLSFVFAAELVGMDSQAIEVLGYTGFALRPFDPSLDVVTGVELVDGRLREIFDLVRHNVPDGELAAFARLMSATCRAAVRIQADNIFGKGKRVPEDDFQDQMQARLGMAAELEGRIERRQQSGGITDLVHDDVVLELKVEHEKAVTPEVAARHIGQPVQYASGAGSQLSVLCLLDMSTKASPAGVLANSVYLLEPRLHGLDDPAYPSWVGVVVISGNLPVPSAWSGKKVTTAPPT